MALCKVFNGAGLAETLQRKRAGLLYASLGLVLEADLQAP